MTWVDAVVLAVLGLSALVALTRGLVREVLGIGAWIGAAIAAAWAFPYVRPHVAQWLASLPELIDPASFAASFLVVLIVLSIVSGWFARLVRASPLGGLDRALGLVFGLLRGAVLVIFAYIAVGMVVPVERWPEPVLEARSLGFAYEGASWVVARLPEPYRPRLYPPPPGRQTSAEALLHAAPAGRAFGRGP